MLIFKLPDISAGYSMEEQHNMVVTMLEAISLRKETYERTYSLPTFPNLGHHFFFKSEYNKKNELKTMETYEGTCFLPAFSNFSP